jgi:hypothetical protein
MALIVSRERVIGICFGEEGLRCDRLMLKEHLDR